MEAWFFLNSVCWLVFFLSFEPVCKFMSDRLPEREKEKR